MKKTYVLTIPGKKSDRLLDASKHEIRKYIRRERNKALPFGADFCDFDCKLGTSPADALTIHLAALVQGINVLVTAETTQFYVEVVAKAGRRAAPAVVESIAVAANGVADLVNRPS